MKKRKTYAVLAVLMTAFIFYNSAKPAIESAKASGEITKNLLNIFAYFGLSANADFLEIIIRKAAHITEFFIHSVFIAKSFSGRYRNRIIYVLFLGLLTACIDENIQLFSDGRSALVTDIFIDFFGTVSGMAVCGIFRGKRR